MEVISMDDPNAAVTDKMKELRQLMLQTLDKKGVLAGVRATMRAGVFCALHEQQALASPPLAPQIVALRASEYGYILQYRRLLSGAFAISYPVPVRALSVALVRDFLVTLDCVHTLSVFEHEVILLLLK